ncbi:7491_t:CDS:1, partial [Cetraspora pellucida]
MIQMITVKDIYKHIISENYQSKSKKAMGKFRKTYCTISLHLLRSLVKSYECDKESISKILKGLCYLIPAMNDYFKFLALMFEQNMEKTDANLILYKSFTLPNNKQVRAMKNYYNTLMFSNVAIFMDLEQEEFKTSDRYCF